MRLNRLAATNDPYRTFDAQPWPSMVRRGCIRRASRLRLVAALWHAE
jgi:hypothetical protein